MATQSLNIVDDKIQRAMFTQIRQYMWEVRLRHDARLSNYFRENMNMVLLFSITLDDTFSPEAA